MRAGRLVSLLLILQDGRRWTARDLADRLEVSERTILRDIEALSGSGVPVYATRGPSGGFELLDTFAQDVPRIPRSLDITVGRVRRVRVRLTPNALQAAQLNGRPEGWRPRPAGSVERSGWLEGSFRFTSFDVAVRELAALGPEVEVLLPLELRDAMREFGLAVAARHDASP